MNRIRLRIWTNGALTATEPTATGATKRVLEFDGRGRYHAVTVDSAGWSETELLLHHPPASKSPSLFLKRTAGKNQDQILTRWIAVSASGVPSSGSTLIHADNSVNWMQKTQSSGYAITVRGDGFSNTREVVNAAGDVASGSTSSVAYDPAGRVQRTVSRATEGSTTTSTTETKPAKNGGEVNRTVTIERDSSGQITSQSTAVTQKNPDRSSSSKTVTADNTSGTTTETTTYTSGSQSATATTVTDTTTGDSVTTTNSSSTSTDAQGNTVTTSTTSVSSSDGFSSSLTTVNSSNGSTGYTSQTTDTSGNTVTTQSATDAAGNTSTTSVATDTAGNQVITTTNTDSGGNGTQTTDTYANDGTQTSSQTSGVTGGSSDSGGGGGGTPGDGGGSGGGDSGGSGDPGSAGGGGSSGMSDPDDGTDEGPRSPTGRVSMGQGRTDPGTGPQTGGDPGGGDIGGGDFGGEGVSRNTGIASYLQGYADGADAGGWGDATSENAPSRAQIDVVVNIPPSADDEGWGNFNNPRAVTGFVQLLVVSAGRAANNARASGVLGALAANGLINAQVRTMGFFAGG